MKIVHVDIETLGLNEETCDIIELGAVFDDMTLNHRLGSLPTFHCYILPPNGKTYTGEPYAMSMHPTILRRIATREVGYRYLTPDAARLDFQAWLMRLPFNKNRATFCGKNFGMFDHNFLKKLPYWRENLIERRGYHHRVLDPGSLYAKLGDDPLPDTKECMRRAGLDGEVAHTAVEDAMTTVALVRHHFHLAC